MLDTSVVRNFGVLGQGSILLAVVPKPVIVADVWSPDGDGEFARIHDAIRRDIGDSVPGSSTHSMWVAAHAGVEGLMRALVDQAEFVASQTADDEMFTRLTSRDEDHRDWRLAQGLRRRPIHRGEASCIGVALRTGFGFATDDGDGAAAYQSLACKPAESTHSLMKLAVEQQVLPDTQARVDWQHLNFRLRGRLDLDW